MLAGTTPFWDPFSGKLTYATKKHVCSCEALSLSLSYYCTFLIFSAKTAKKLKELEVLVFQTKLHPFYFLLQTWMKEELFKLKG